MPRPRTLLTAIVTTALLSVLTAGTASAASPEGGTIVRVKFEPRASDGFEARLETSEKKVVRLELERGGSSVIYEVPGEVSEAGLKVRFGKLGLIDVAFTPTKTLSTTAPAGGCTGAPRTLREGVFTGTIAFTGERGYVRLEGPEASGTMSVISQWDCPGSEVALPYGNTSLLSSLRPHKAGSERESASLHLFSFRRPVAFAAGVHHRHSGGRSIFVGYKGELREGMEIIRSTAASGAASRFDYDHKAGTASLRPPRPLSGQATFKRRPDAKPLWRSTIKVPLLGADPIDTSGPGFRVGLYPEYHFD